MAIELSINPPLAMGRRRRGMNKLATGCRMVRKGVDKVRVYLNASVEMSLVTVVVQIVSPLPLRAYASVLPVRPGVFDIASYVVDEHNNTKPFYNFDFDMTVLPYVLLQ